MAEELDKMLKDVEEGSGLGSTTRELDKAADEIDKKKSLFNF